MKTLIFGAGDFGTRYLIKAEQEGEEVIGFLDNSELIRDRKIFGCYSCYSPERVAALEYDKVVIANGTSDKVRSKIHTQLLALGVSAKQIEYFPAEKTQDVFDIMGDRANDSRISTFRLIARFTEEQCISGNVAECGVNKGGTAKHLNRFFADRKLYLFDTFEGLAKQDIDAGRDLGDVNFLEGSHNHVGGWNHSVDLVMKKMMFPLNIILVKGWIPQSFEGIDDIFCFVHLDLDLYQPMLAALKFFWDKMSKGGVLLLHDYNSPSLPGVKKAVDDFEAWLGCKVPKYPLAGYCLALIKD